MPHIVDILGATDQLDSFLEVNWDDPLAKKLVYASALAGNSWDAVRQRFGTNTAVIRTAVAGGEALQFTSASSSQITLPTANLASGYPITVSCWCDLTDSGAGEVIYSLNGTSYHAVMGPLGTALYFSTDSAPGFQGFSGLSGVHHTLTVFRSGSFSFYLDGVLQVAVGASNNWGQPAAGNHSIGSRLGGASIRYNNGPTRDFCVWGRELSSDEALEVYKNSRRIFKRDAIFTFFSNTPSLYKPVELPFVRTSQPPSQTPFELTNEFTQNLVFGYIPGDLNLLRSGTIPINENKQGKGAYTDGTGTFLYRNSALDFTLDECTVITLTRPSAIASTDRTVVSQGYSADSLPKFLLGQGSTTNNLSFRVRDSAGTDVEVQATSSAWANGELAIAAGTRSASAGLQKLFINGDLLGSSAVGSAAATSFDRFSVGCYYGVGQSGFYQGETNLVLVFKKAFSERQIFRICQNLWQIWQNEQNWQLVIPSTSHAASGGLVADAASISGAAVHPHATSGALVASAATIAGVAADEHAASGGLVAQDAVIAGTATHLTLHTTSGALAASDATIAGSANRSTTHPTSGALVASDAIIAGTATHLTLHTSSGDLVAGDAALAGAASRAAPGSHAASGALTADVAVIAGSAAHFALHTSTGALVAQEASIAGTALHTPIHAASGGLVASEGALLGIALRTPAPTAHDATGGLVAGAAEIAGLATGPALPFFSVSGGGIKPKHHKKPTPSLFDEELKAPTAKLKKAVVPSFTPSTFVPYAKMGVPKALSKALGEVLVGPLSAPLREVLPPEYDDDDIPDEVIMLALQ